MGAWGYPRVIIIATSYNVGKELKKRLYIRLLTIQRIQA